MRLSPEAREHKRADLIQAARTEFAARGYAATAMADIARTAGVGKGTLYEYFRSKEDLFFAVFEDHHARLFKTTSAGLAPAMTEDSDPADTLRALNTTLVQSWDVLRPLFSLIMEFWSASASPPLRDRFQEPFRRIYSDYRGLVSGLLRRGQTLGRFRADANADALAAALVGGWDSLFLQAWFDPEFDLDEVAREFLENMLQGLEPR